MNLTIKPLTLELADDFFDFFDNRAFSDRKAAFCYCTWFHFDCSIEEHYKHGQEAMRNQAMEYIAAKKLNGYLAFADGVSVGFCNADDKENYKRIKKEILTDNDEPRRIKSIVCFTIAPEFRGKGIASALLLKVIDDAKTEGYFAVESYPQLHDEHNPFDYAGPIRLFEKSGFIKAAKKDKTIIMQKGLR
jgi:GNAT superfamily N-acetyltransferase